MRARLLISLMPLAWLAGHHPHSFAQTPAAPDAGSIRQQLEPLRTLPLPSAAAPVRAAPPSEIRAPAGMTVRVRSFRLAGNSLLTTDQLTSALSELIGQNLGFEGLQRAADVVARVYREAGWIVRTYLPEQDVSEGTITIQVVEAHYAGLRLEGHSPQRVMPSEIEAYFRRQQSTGLPLNAHALDRALLLADDLPGVSIAGTLAPGAKEGDTALVLQTTEEAGVYGDIGLDNTGARSTGRHRLSANLNVNSPGQRGELLSLSALHTQGSDYGRVAFTVPDGHNGLRLGLSATAMHYRIVDGTSDLQALNIRGRSSSLGLDWSFPLVRARQHNLYFSGGLENKHFYNDNRNSNAADPKSYSDYDTDSLRLSLSGNRFDSLGGGGANSASLQVQWGRLTRMTAHSALDSIDRTYNKVNYNFTRQQSLSGAHSLLLSLQGQHARQVLDSSEKLYIGGAGTVRAYPASELGGERGQMLSAEWRWRLTSDWALAAFVDHGRIVSLPPTPSDQKSALNLRGYGFSASWQGPQGMTTKLTWSHRTGNHPRPTPAGTDGDGTLQKDRFWFSASMPF